MDRVVASVEPTLRVNTQELVKLDRHLDSLRTLVEDRTSAARTVTWVQLGALILFLLIPIGGAASTVVYKYVLPNRVDEIVLASKDIDSRLNEKLKPINENVITTNEQLKKLDESVNKLNRAMKQTLNRNRVLPTLRRQVGAPRRTLNTTLPAARELFAVVREMGVPLTGQDYKSLSQPLLDNYASASEPVKEQIAQTLVEAAKGRTATNDNGGATAIAEAKQAGNYFEGIIDLSSRPTWKGALFSNCTIVLSKPETPVLLDGVRFVNCDFQGDFKESAHRELLTAILQSSLPTVSATIEPKAEVLQDRKSDRSTTR
jgi:hypothetical protein